MKKILKHLRSKINRKNFIVIIFILLASFAGIFTYLKSSTDNNKVEAEEVITYSTDNPDESKSNADNYNWRGGPDDPRKIIIPKIGVESFIQQAGVDQNRKVAVPNNVHLAGWFVESVKPGQKGLSIISGHVSGRGTDGVFKRLDNLNKDDTFSIELGNGEIKNFKVLTRDQVKESDSARLLFDQNPKVSNQLNLITCGGSFDRGSNQYSDRVIVTAELQ